MRKAPALEVSETDLERLRLWQRSPSTPQGVAKRIAIVLLASEGKSNMRIAEEAGVSRPTVILWRKRYLEEGADTVWRIRPGRGRKREVTGAWEELIVSDTLYAKPEGGATQWSTRTMAKRHGISHSTVRRIWREHGLKPHLKKAFKLSRDPQFSEKLRKVVSLYTDPPKGEVVLCVDEKSQIQALDRTQPGLPLWKGRRQTMTHDYKRNGTTSLFASLQPATGRVVGRCFRRHTNREFVRFLNVIARAYPKGKVNLILDNYSTHNHANVKAWLLRNKRFHFHFIPTSSSWLNQIESWFAQLKNKRLRRGVFRCVKELKNAIRDFIDAYNERAKPFKWKSQFADIMHKVNKCKAILWPNH